MSLYRNICRSLFEKDKLLFSFLLAVRLLEFRNQLDSEILRFLLTGGLALDQKMPDHPSLKFPNQDLEWISNRMWSEVCKLSLYNGFNNFYSNFYDLKTLNEFKAIYDSLTP